MLKIDDILLSTPFKVAKTMPKIPHEYTLKQNWEDKELFQYVCDYILMYGKKEWFFRTQYSYYYIGGYKYWTMMNSETKEYYIINRAKV